MVIVGEERKEGVGVMVARLEAANRPSVRFAWTRKSLCLNLAFERAQTRALCFARTGACGIVGFCAKERP
jgi:hypothetical protein